MKQTLSVAFLAMIAFSACSADKQFLAPQRIPHFATKGTFISNNGDTVNVRIGVKYQPTFVDNNGTELKSSLTINSMVYKSRSGNQLNGWLVKPLAPTKALVTLLFFHGNGGNITTEYNAITPLVERGFQVFIFDYSGYGFSEGKATRTNLLLDGESTLDMVRSLEDTKNTKLIIYGQSLGGHLGIVVGSRYPDLIDGIVSEAAFSSHKDIAAKNVRLGFAARLLLKEKYSASEAVKAFHKPILFIHSTEDQTVPFYMSEKLYSNANNPKSLYTIRECHACATQYYVDSIKSRVYMMIKL